MSRCLDTTYSILFHLFIFFSHVPYSSPFRRGIKCHDNSSTVRYSADTKTNILLIVNSFFARRRKLVTMVGTRAAVAGLSNKRTCNKSCTPHRSIQHSRWTVGQWTLVRPTRSCLGFTWTSRELIAQANCYVVTVIVTHLP